MSENKPQQDQELLWAIGMDKKFKVLYIEQIDLNANPTEIFRMAIHKLATGIILVRNRPSNLNGLTNSDIGFTDNLIKIGRLLNVAVVDHLIVSEKEYQSLADEGIVARLEQSGKLRVVDSVSHELKEWKNQVISNNSLRGKPSMNLALVLKQFLESIGEYFFDGKKKSALLERFRIENERLKIKSEVDKILKQEAELKNQLIQHEINAKFVVHLKELGYTEEYIQDMFEQNNKLSFIPVNKVETGKSRVSSVE